MSLFKAKKKYSEQRSQYLITDDVDFNVLESFRNLKANVSVSIPKKADGGAVTIMMTSACPEDGKTTVAVNLALMYAFSTRKVLLIDADVRKGRVGRFFRHKSSPGLTDCVTGLATLEEVTHHLPDKENFAYITCGTHSPHPYELLASEQMKSLLKELQQQYDYIIIDTPPLLLLSDCIALAPEVDGTIVVCRHQTTYVSDIARTLNALNFAKANVIGVVVNDYTPEEKREYSKYHYNYYTYGHHDKQEETVEQTAEPSEN